jgi:ribose 5-phosphate isomerase A
MPAIAGIFRCSTVPGDQLSSAAPSSEQTSTLLVPGRPMDQDAKKLIAAKASLEYIQNGTTLGIGTGSTVNHLIDLLPGVSDKIEVIVSSSESSTASLQALGFEVSRLNAVGDLDLYIDGADEATKHMHLIKGGGGALTREKVLAGAARKFVCIIDESKLVGMLGTFPLPIEVLPMAQAFVARKLVKMRGQPIWRENFVTDNGNHILDVHNLSIANPLEMETRINQIPGVVSVGIFSHRPADVLLIADDTGVRTMGN